MRYRRSMAWMLAVAFVAGATTAMQAQGVLPSVDSQLANLDVAARGDFSDSVDLDDWSGDADRECEPEWSPVFPRWSFTADALFLDRRTPGSAVLVTNTQDATQFLNASAFNFPVQAGWDLSLTRQFEGDLALEVRYFAVDQWIAMTSSATTPDDQLRINSGIPIFTLAGTSVDASASSRLHSFELNGRRRFSDRLTLLAGFRYVELDEHLRFNLANATIPFTYDAFTRNRLYGAQLGGDILVWDRGGPLTVSAIAKAGLYGNSAGQDSAYTTGLVTLPASGSKSSAAFLGEVGVTGTLRLTDNLAIRSGYRLLWIDGVALATDQVAASEFVLGHGLDAKGDTFYHGAFLGFEYSR